MDGYEELANAVILLAVRDYRTARKRLRKHPNDHYAESEIHRCERFFKGPVFEIYTNIDGPSLLRRLQEETDA